MLSRRDFVAVAAAAAAITFGPGRHLAGAASATRVTQDDLLRFEGRGQVTLLHMADCHAQLNPLYLREPEHRRSAPPGTDLDRYLLTPDDFVALARRYGRVGGMDRLATLIRAIRAERGEDRVLLLDGGDAMQGSYTALATYAADMVRVLNALRVDATTGHWEFTYGETRLRQIEKELTAYWLAGNVVEDEWQEPAFRAMQSFEKGGLKLTVIGQAYPFTAIANPRWMVPRWSFGIRETTLRQNVETARAAGADVVILLSHNGLEVDRKLATRVAGIDVIFSAHTHDALAAPELVNGTLLIASGSHTKFLSRLDLEVGDRKVLNFAYRLIPVLADAIVPDPDMTKLIAEIRAPHEAMLATPLARTEALLYRRDTVGGTFDDLICRAIAREQNAEIALSPGFRWGPTLLPDQKISNEDLYAETAITYPACWRREMTGADIKARLEDVADNLFNPDPYYRQGGDMVRAGGLDFTLDPREPAGRRISGLTLRERGEVVDAGKTYTVAGWASTAEDAQGPPIWDVVGAWLTREQIVRAEPQSTVKLVEG